MRNLLALVGAAVVTFAGLGWYLGWYTLQRTSSDTPGHQSVNIDFDARKITADIRNGEQKVEKALHKTVQGDSAKTVPGQASH